MGIINPIMLFFSLGALLIALMYFIKNKYVDHIVPSTMLWEMVLNEESNVSKLDKFKNRLIMYLQILILMLLVLMLAGVYINSKEEVNGDALFFIDNSIMMDYRENGKSNLDKAKEEAIKMVEKSSDDASFTIVDALGYSLYASEKKDAIKAIKELYQLNTNLDIALVQNKIDAFRSSRDDAYVFVFSNNMDIEEDRNFRYKSMKENLALIGIDVFKESYKLDIRNYSKGEKNIEIILKLDNETIDIFSVDLAANELKTISSKLEGEGSILSAKINTRDDIEIDNYASKSIELNKEYSVFLSHNASTYLRDALILNDNLIISESVDKEILNENFDIYIYDGVEPDKLPKTGSMLIINPPSSSKFANSDVNEEMYVKLTTDEINSFVEAFYVASSKQVNLKSLKSVATVDGKSIIQKGMIGELKSVVMGFDLLETNLPLKYSFPIYIQNIIQYFTSETNEDELHIVSDQIDMEKDFSSKEEEFVYKSGSSNSIINLKALIAIFVFLFLAIEMEVFKREY